MKDNIINNNIIINDFIISVSEFFSAWGSLPTIYNYLQKNTTTIK